LKQAEQVVFVGYSFPVTDIASCFLFAESISPGCRVRVVNYTNNKKVQKEIRDRYRKIFSNIRPEYFEFDGALNWANKLIQHEESEIEKLKKYIYSKKKMSGEQGKILSHLYFEQAQSIEELSKNTKLSKERVLKIVNELSGLIYDKNSNGLFWAKVINQKWARHLGLEASQDRKDG